VSNDKQPTIYFADINDPDETETEEPNFCDVVLVADYERDTQALQDRYDCNTAIMRARTEALSRVTYERDAALKQLEGQRALLARCQEKLHPHRDAVLWGEVYDALRAKPCAPTK
jgi:hypothetical protein